MYAPHTPRNPAPRLNAKYFARCECSVGADGNPPAKDCEASFLLLERGASSPLRDPVEKRPFGAEIIARLAFSKCIWLNFGHGKNKDLDQGFLIGVGENL